MSRKRGRNIDKIVEQRIIGILDGWSGKLTWDRLIEEVFAQVGHAYVRQALAANEQIFFAYTINRSRVRKAPAEVFDPEASPEVCILKQLNARLSAENKRLLAENNAYRETFTTWAYNASNRGLSNEYLSMPIPLVNREQTRDKQ